jgi:hypothetical protein
MNTNEKINLNILKNCNNRNLKNIVFIYNFKIFFKIITEV